MRIKSLEIAGFKSFVDRTRFGFRAGITAIVGPNGCGKSNVVDAIRWAMGEQSPRRLRGKGMEDVIFAGSDERQPVGLAEVVLTFDNGEGVAPAQYVGFSEIEVARRLYRSGESEYLINKVAVRLRDVQDFFRDTGIGTKGYTIVEQGRIAEIVSAKPEERRALIEEAAGISKYKARRREAERKLEATEQNLVRVSDVLGEIRRQIGSIERQARKAARYKRLRETQRLLELSIASDDRAELLRVLEAKRRELLTLRDATTAAETRLGECEAEAERHRLELAEHERSVVEGNESLYQARARVRELEGQIAYERRERASLAEANEARGRELESLREQESGAREETERQRDELRAVEEALAGEAEAAAGAERDAETARKALRSVERERDQKSEAQVEILTAVARGEDRRSAAQDRVAEIDRRLRSADEQLEVQQGEATRADDEQQALEEGLRNLLAERDRLMHLLRESLERHERLTEQTRAAVEAASEARERCETRRARLGSLREILTSREDVGEGARSLLAEDADRHGIRALVRDLFEADPEVEVAVEAVLAEIADGLVLERAEGALSALESLRASEAGRGVFVLPSDEVAVSRGFVPLGEPLLERVRPRPGAEIVARRLLGAVNLVPDLREAIDRYASGRIPCTFVTFEGDVLTADGVVRGGGAPGRGALARAREVRELEQEVGTLEREAARCATAQRVAETELAEIQDQLENLRNRHHTAALAVANHEKDLERTRERVKAIGEAREGRVEERSELLAEGEALREEIERLATRIQGGQEDKVRGQRDLERLALQVGSSGRELARLEAVLAERRAQHRGRVETRDRLAEVLGRTERAAREAQEWIERREGEIEAAVARRAELLASIEAAEGGLAEALRQEEQTRLGSDRRRDAYEQVAAAAREADERARGLRGELAGAREQVQQSELSLREGELRLEHQETQIRDKWSVDLASWKPPVPATGAPESAVAAPGEEDEEDRDAQREAREHAELLALGRPERAERLEEVRRGLEAIGEVNLSAIEEHEELRERFRFLSEEKADLEGSIGQLRDAIARINRTSRKRFRETFEAVNERFQKNFPRLFRGGKANLSLTEHEDVLEAGIEIMAQPPGKRLQSVNLLSGGEKTMTAIALLVSVFQVRPSPFFLLDEVDAALDDANVGRFNEIVKELAEDSQFLLITHNKRTIEVGDVLYGVTMEEKGVSKLVSVELH